MTVKWNRSLEKENEAIKDKIVRDISNLFEQGKDQLLRVGNLWDKNYIQYESNGNGNKTLSIEKHLNKIRPYLKSIIDDLRKSDVKSS